MTDKKELRQGVNVTIRVRRPWGLTKIVGIGQDGGAGATEWRIWGPCDRAQGSAWGLAHSVGGEATGLRAMGSYRYRRHVGVAYTRMVGEAGGRL